MNVLRLAKRKWVDTPFVKKLWENKLLTALTLQSSQLRTLGLKKFTQWNSVLLNVWVRDRLNCHTYTLLNEADLRTTRKSDRVFVFGSGYSLNDISPAEWQQIAKHDTLGFSGFIYQQWIRVDYHLIRGWVETIDGALRARNHTLDFARTLNENPHFQNTILIMQGEYVGQFCNSLIGYRLLKPGSRIFRYTTVRKPGLPTRSLQEGLCHNPGTLADVVNFAYCLGWKEIVLVGVDLYDSRYFWLKPDETLAFDQETGMLVPSKQNTRDIRYDRMHNTASNGVVKVMGQWREFMEQEGVHLSVYNPRSLMADVMPVYQGK